MGESIRRAKDKEKFVHLLRVRMECAPQADLHTHYAAAAYTQEFVVQLWPQAERPAVASPVIIRFEGAALVVIAGTQRIGKVIEGDLARLSSLAEQSGRILLATVARHSSVELEVLHIALTNLEAGDVAA